MKAVGKIALMAAISILAMSQILLSQGISDRRLISVTGDAEVKVVPDQAAITLDIGTTDNSIIEAKKSNDQMIKKLSEFARDFGINEKDITSDHISVNPRYESDIKKPGGFDVRRRVTISLNDVTKFDDLLTGLLSHGLDRVQDIKFFSTELRKYKDSARAMAIRAANEKAQAMASELGLKVGKVCNIEEKNSNSRMPYGNWSGYNSMPNPFNASRDVEPPEPIIYDSPTPLGKISVTASVAVTFELE